MGGRSLESIDPECLSILFSQLCHSALITPILFFGLFCNNR